MTSDFCVNIFHIRLAVINAVGVVLVPLKLLFQTLFQWNSISHKIILLTYVKHIFIIIEAEVLSLRYFFTYANKLSGFADCLIT